MANPSIHNDDRVSLIILAILHLNFDERRHYISEGENGERLFALLDVIKDSPFLNDRPVDPHGHRYTSMSATDPRDPLEQASFLRLRNSLIQAIADVAATPKFLEHNSTPQSLSAMRPKISKFLLRRQPLVEQCCCLILGNVAQSDDICIFLVSSLEMHICILQVLSASDDSGVVHAAVGALRNLALPQVNKSKLGEDGAIAALAVTWKSDFLPEVQYGAAAVVRQLVNQNLPNVQRLLGVSASNKCGDDSSQAPLSRLIFMFEKSSDQATRMETSRIVAGILRTVYTDRSLTPDGRTELLSRLWMSHRSAAMVLGSMVAQTQLPVLRSEGWFALALAARSKEGCKAIVPVLVDDHITPALKAALRFRSEISEKPEQLDPEPDRHHGASASSEDMQNAKIMIHEISKNKACHVSSPIF